MAWRSHRKELAIVGLFLFLMGVVVPAAFGLLTEKAMDLGTADALESLSSISQKYGVAAVSREGENGWNSTYFIEVWPQYYCSETSAIYNLEAVYDSENNLLEALAEKTDFNSSASITTDAIPIYVLFNASALENVDRIEFSYRILSAPHPLNGTGQVYLSIDGQQFKLHDVNMSEAMNSTVRVKIDLDAVTKLHIKSASTVKLVFKYNSDSDESLEGTVYGFDVALYDVKKVNATAASNIMLAVSGVLGWLGALAATPYWNPYSNREHRNVRRVGRAVKRRIPRRRR